MPERFARKGDLRRGRVLLAGTLVLAGTILVAIFTFTKPTTIFERSVSELLRRPLLETTVRLEGFIVRGSLCKVPSKCEYRFRLAESPYPAGGPGNELEVRYGGCVVPDTFRDVPGYDFKVIMQGELREDRSHFDATTIMAQCPSKYEKPSDPAILEAYARPIRPCSSSESRP
jgi:cytochrome c-type biogenesis protein CcmE